MKQSYSNSAQSGEITEDLVLNDSRTQNVTHVTGCAHGRV
jgi:hypothetical protein